MQADAPLLDQKATLRSRQRRLAPGPHYYTPFGALSTFRRNPLQFYLEAAKFGDIVRVQMGPWFYHFLTHPDHIKYVLQDNNQNYGRSIFMTMLKPALGDGLLTSEGDFWHRQRRLAQPAFHRQRLAAFATIMTEAAEAMLERWHPVAVSGQPLEIMAEMSNLTLGITGKALFGSDISPEEMMHAQQGFLEHFNHRFEHFFTVCGGGLSGRGTIRTLLVLLISVLGVRCVDKTVFDYIQNLLIPLSSYAPPPLGNLVVC